MLFEEFLNEFNYGKILFGDPSVANDEERYKRLLKLPFEPNTMEEYQLIAMLKDWFHQEKAAPFLGKALKELLPLKKKFPKILEPTKGRDNMYDGTEFFRGTMMPLKQVLGLTKTWKKYDGIGLYSDEAIEADVKFTWNAKSRKGFTSFSPSSETAEEFADQIGQEEYGAYTPGYNIIKKLQDGDTSGNIPVILKIKDTHPQALMNPEFTSTVSFFHDEFEIFVIGSNIQIDGIIIPRWEQYTNAATTEGFDQLDKYFNIR